MTLLLEALGAIPLIAWALILLLALAVGVAGMLIAASLADDQLREERARELDALSPHERRQRIIEARREWGGAR